MVILKLLYGLMRVAGEPVLPMLQQRYGNNVDAEVHRITEITKTLAMISMYVKAQLALA